MGRVDHLHDVLAGHVERGEVPGVVTLLSRRGKVQVDAIGTKAVGGADPMGRDTIFRVASMTKPITAAATLILVEEGKLRLDDPVDSLLPELARRQVLKRIDGPIDDTVPALRPITVRDLLTFRLGFGLIAGRRDAYPILKAADELQIMTALPNPPTPHAPDEWMRRLGTLPLMHQPGERWMYHTGSDVLGVLIARASGQPLAAFFRERIFEPLGMKDTGFSVPAAERGRLAPAYRWNPESKTLQLYDDVADGAWSRPPAFASGGGGLVSTVDDYLAFGQMLLSGGRHGNRRVLSRPSVEAMTTDQLTSAQKAVSELVPGFWKGRGWGFGVSLLPRRDDAAAVSARFGWDGGFGTSWCSDPEEGLVAILMTQRLGFPLTSEIRRDFWDAVDQVDRF
jgi:CubicO group peptidase (beta-lactamase class C family)